MCKPNAAGSCYAFDDAASTPTAAVDSVQHRITEMVLTINKPSKSHPIGLVLTSSGGDPPIVTEIDTESPAQGTLKLGDCIVSVNGDPAEGAQGTKARLMS
ncbi:hypothetical protein EMIHUDRAFT_242550 [Emiliania huxleyi CCMP1516]|uniref:PDZ domain-containing protein n=2 Tax=Emiliania huxleyi TaxID=2903 RepID=A0A0D3J8G0_EMIH1|nr:hypothetical protein EMIHUDRAFT_242550 [Emiliania huxleyi CCMP1516]EOD19795.1 hypothetical protein EMIHUDRAFT_242550 [Emiliania huxleyi CCMP1516]|eukprot:XP_005772224.1 hypothetical protein EMIHUDRAFT_242550 [Emiliania huxleyi CCMP1516]